MKTCVLLLLVLGCVYGAPVGEDGLEPGSCDDPSAVSAAHLALTKINLDRREGYVFSLHRLSNVHMFRNEEVGVVYYLTLDVEETNCSVLSRKDWKACEARRPPGMQVYGQCKAAIYISKPHRVTRLYKYRCLVRPVPAARVTQVCPDCPTFVGFDNEQVNKTVTLSLKKFNKESGLNNRFALLHIARATAGMAMSMYYNVEYAIQETTCNSSTEANDCSLMTCEFAHTGFCKASLFYGPSNEPDVSVECEIFESEAALREKEQHLLGNQTGHSHNDTHRHDRGEGHSHHHGHGHGHRHSNDNDKRPGNDHGHGHNDNDRRPGNDHGHGHNDNDKRPGNDHGHGHNDNDRRPGNDHGHGHNDNDKKPGNDHGHGHNDNDKRPGNDHGHGHSNDNDKKPGNDHGHGHNDNDRRPGNDHGHGHSNDNDKKPGNDHGHGHNDNDRRPGNDHGHGHSNDNDKRRGNDHGHGNNRTRGNDRGHSRLSPHDHIHDHTKDHSHHHLEHPLGSDHHHSHDHKPGSAYRHAHDHSHDHGINHDHVHAYHAQANDHRGDFPNQHHDYKHPEGTHTHEHDHELALDHDHKHAHLHEYEHHHHHHKHEHEGESHDQPEGQVKVVAALGQPLTSPIFPKLPPTAVILMLKPDPQIPGKAEPNILDFEAFPATASPQCPVPDPNDTLVKKLFIEDDLFKPGNKL